MGVPMKFNTEKEKTTVISFRTSISNEKTINLLCRKLELKKSEILNIALLEFITNFPKDLTYKGIDFKKIAEIRKVRLFRDIQKIERRELMSRHLFLDNVMRNIYLYILKKKTPQQIRELLDTYKKETKYYTNPEIQERFKDFELSITNEKLGELKQKLELEIGIRNLLK